MVSNARRYLEKIYKPLRNIEYVISFLVLASTIVAIVAIASPDITRSSTLATLVDQYSVVPILFGLLATFAVVDITALSSAHSSNSLRLRAISTFAFATGYSFLVALSLLSEGFDNLLWVNDLAVVIISAILYLNIKVAAENERI